jgi:hypothetical protein
MEAEIIEIGGLRRNRFYTELEERSRPLLTNLMDVIEFCRKIEALGGDISEDALDSMSLYMEALQLLFPSNYASLVGESDGG